MKRKLRIYKLLYEAFWILWKSGGGIFGVVHEFNFHSKLTMKEYTKILNEINKKTSENTSGFYLFPQKKKYIFKRLRIFKEILERIL